MNFVGIIVGIDFSVELIQDGYIVVSYSTFSVVWLVVNLVANGFGGRYVGGVAVGVGFGHRTS